ncbi:hypothetical protein Ciccas_013809 [Cichlidogyrus casuarinus]|uniref:Uncharacterized protein n=1 Tax=Cichlidogyrus casuarinus TaxID=1844966 RepID=A0ABD2PPK8_9PLAT
MNRFKQLCCIEGLSKKRKEIEAKNEEERLKNECKGDSEEITILPGEVDWLYGPEEKEVIPEEAGDQQEDLMEPEDVVFLAPEQPETKKEGIFCAPKETEELAELMKQRLIIPMDDHLEVTAKRQKRVLIEELEDAPEEDFLLKPVTVTKRMEITDKKPQNSIKISNSLIEEVSNLADEETETQQPDHVEMIEQT